MDGREKLLFLRANFKKDKPSFVSLATQFQMMAKSSKELPRLMNLLLQGNQPPLFVKVVVDRSAVTGGTKVLSDRILVRITADPGNSFIDRMIILLKVPKDKRLLMKLLLVSFYLGYHLFLFLP